MNDQEFYMTADEVQKAYGIDLITAETLRNGLIEVTRHMHGSLIRSGFSGLIRDNMDFAVIVHLVCDDGTTELAAITEGATMFAFVHQQMANMVLEEYGLDLLGSGDTLVCNDAFRGGIHRPDISFFRVVHDERGQPAFVVSDCAHVFDIGGPVAGGFNNAATNMYEEGLVIPPMLITSQDRLVRPVINLLVENTRSPTHMIGDLRALLGTLRAGEDRLRELLERYGTTAVKAAARYAIDLAERRMRRALLEVEDGDYEAVDNFDDDGVGTEPVRMQVTLRVRGSNAEIDFSGTDRQPTGPLTTCWQETARSIIGPKMILDPTHPMNAGAMRPFHVLLPAGSVVLGLPPTSHSQHGETAGKVAALMLQVMSRALPARGVAPDAGTCGFTLVYGTDYRPGREGQPFGTGLVFGEGWGGTQVCDGTSFCQHALANCRQQSTELLEKEMPIVVWECGVTIDSPGAGKYRGGFASSYTLEALGHATCTVLLDRARFPGEGTAGGAGGMPSYGMLVAKDAHGSPVSWNGILPAARLVPIFGLFDERKRPDPIHGEWGKGSLSATAKLNAFPLQPGDVIRFHVGSPGGYGDPLDRDPQLVLRDVSNERISIRQAAESYGVVIDVESLTIHEPATYRLRARLAGLRLRGEWQPLVSTFRHWPVTEEEFELLVATTSQNSIEMEV